MNTLYKIKKAILSPYVWYMKRVDKTEDKFRRTALELHAFSKDAYQYFNKLDTVPNFMCDFKLGDDSLVWDVGGYFGEWTDDVLALNPNVNVHIFEAYPGMARNLKEKFQDKSNIQIYDIGLSNTNYETKFHFAWYGSSEFFDALDGAEPIGIKDVTMRDVTEYIDKIDEVDLMKMNIEGGEYAVLDKLIETGNIKKFNCMYLQFHEWIDDSYSKRRKIIKALKKTHRCEWSYYFLWEKWVRK